MVEQDISEQVIFFQLNSPSSSIVIKVDFDLTLSVLAHNLYRVLANKLEGFENCTAPTIFRNFLDTAAKIKIENKLVTIYLKKSHLPVLFGTKWIQEETEISWFRYKIRFEIDTSS